ncbi:amino acid adenylation domain-containing protein [Amycolatopsis coloradensis]|uniref:Amino acid adenylation domain-containing protein n=1 Tax=Amycolatopsis coloradensis TaxID=76021 RepID=A0ACD5BNR0_9PSEU
MRLSLGQERLWLVQQLDRTSAAYNIPIVFRFHDGVDFDVLDRALGALVERHPVLRWRFVVDETGTPAAVPTPGFRIPVARRIAEDDDWQNHTADLVSEPFDLAAAPPIRAMVVECADGSAVLCVVNHHIITDGRSIQIVTEDVVKLYRSETPAPLEVTYEEYVAVQRAAAGSVAEHIDYWRRELDGYEPLRLPTDRPRSGNPGFAGDHVDFVLPAELTKAFSSFALRNRCALSSAVAAVFQALLALHSGQEDITIGTVLAGRDDRRFADVLGFFVNTVVLRARITPSMSFRELLKVARTKMVDAYAHQQAPFDQVVAEVRPERDAGRNAIFDVVVVHNGEIPADGEGEISSVHWAGVATRFDLELVTHVQDGRLHGSLVFRTGLFDRSTATRLVGRLIRLVEHTLAHPDEPIFEALRGQLDYWRKQLDDLPAALELPADHARPPVASYRAGSLSFDVDPGIREAGSRHDTTLFMTLLAAFDVVLSRYARTTDVTVGVPVPEAKMLVLRNDLSGDPTFAELLGRVRETTLGAYANQDVPFERLVEELAPRRDFSRTPLAQVVLRVVDEPVPDVAPVGTRSEPFDLECLVSDRDGVLEARIDYNAEVFDQVTIEHFVRHFRRLLASAEPELPLSAWPMMSDAELRRLTEDWNDTTTELPSPATVPAVFAAQVRDRPQATALICGDDSVTYEELDVRSNRLAHRLRTLGAGPGTVIGVCLPRSPGLITALLAILKTGAAYLPIDPEYPEERQRLLLTDGGARLMIATDLIGDPTLGQEPATALGTEVAPRDLAYVIYTSGSTGRPKGVEIEHRSIIRLVTGLPEGILGPDEVVLHASAISFDAATFEIWGALLTGATCVISTERVLTARPLANAITRHRISTAWLTSSLFNHVVDEDSSALAGLRQLLVGGEALSVTHVRRAVTALPGTKFFNGYGPTECTTFATCHPIPAPVPGNAKGIPIGRPLGNTRVYVLDELGRPTPTGVPGELHVAGPGVARGYRGQPELTEEQFVADPHDTVGGRLYRTGDIVRYNADGDLEYLGRVDDQVKIRGFRIEPREIETALLARPEITQAAVIAREDGSGQKRLVAYLKGTFDDTTLRAGLRRELPEYMVPSAFVSLPELPLTINGKLDVRALPEPEDDLRRDKAAPPRNPTEEKLAAIWAQVLGRETVGRDESFFDVGGHSLKAAQLAVRIGETLRIDLPLRTLFERPTIAKLAEEINGERRAAVRSFDPRARLRDVLPEQLPSRGSGGVAEILLTGATGFVGAYLVRELLTRENVRVHCLVRASDEHSGWQRLRENLDRYGLSDDVDEKRISVVPGDLAAPGLGLTDAVFARLASEIDLICHNGAWVDALSSYEQLEGANVGGTGELIRLAATTRLKRLQFVSTISAGEENGSRSGYAETKAHAEQLVTTAYERGMPAAICRLPRIVGDSRTGQGNTRDIMLRVLRAILELGAAPDTEIEEPWIAVDETAGALARLGLDRRPDGSRFVLAGERPMRLTYLVGLLRSAGTEIGTLPVADWLSALEARSPEEHAILKLLFGSPSSSGLPSSEFEPVVVPSPDDGALLRYVDRMLVRTSAEGLSRK